jgi:hypothetical protein
MRKRGTGSVGTVAGSPYYYIWYRHNGRTIRESTRSESKMVAEALLSRRIGETGLGIRPAQETKKYKYEEARAALLADYESKGRSSLVTRADGTRTICGLVQLDEYFAGRSAASITADDVRDSPVSGKRRCRDRDGEPSLSRACGGCYALLTRTGASNTSRRFAC